MSMQDVKDWEEFFELYKLIMQEDDIEAARKYYAAYIRKATDND